MAIPQIIGAAAGVASVGLSITGASSGNAAAKAQQKFIAKLAALQIGQLGEQVALQKLKIQHEAEQIRGRIRVSAAERGTGTGGSFQALITQSSFDEALNQLIADTNYEFNVLSIQGGAGAQHLHADMLKQNMLLAAFMGGVTGITTGLQIHRGLSPKE